MITIPKAFQSTYQNTKAGNIHVPYFIQPVRQNSEISTCPPLAIRAPGKMNQRILPCPEGRFFFSRDLKQVCAENRDFKKAQFAKSLCVGGGMDLNNPNAVRAPKKHLTHECPGFIFLLYFFFQGGFESSNTPTLSFYPSIRPNPFFVFK